MPGAALGRSLVVQELGKQNALPAVLTFDEALHLQLRSSVVEILAQPTFSHSLGPNRTCWNVRRSSAIRRKADIEQPHSTRSIYESTLRSKISAVG
jgi:hypothetical protein